MAKQRIKDIQTQLRREAEMTTRQASLIRELYAERDKLVRQTEVLNKENKILSARCTEWRILASNLMTQLTDARADLIVQQSTEGD